MNRLNVLAVPNRVKTKISWVENSRKVRKNYRCCSRFEISQEKIDKSQNAICFFLNITRKLNFMNVRFSVLSKLHTNVPGKFEAIPTRKDLRVLEYKAEQMVTSLFPAGLFLRIFLR